MKPVVKISVQLSITPCIIIPNWGATPEKFHKILKLFYDLSEKLYCLFLLRRLTTRGGADDAAVTWCARDYYTTQVNGV
jgi:hypothetical protein